MTRLTFTPEFYDQFITDIECVMGDSNTFFNKKEHLYLDKPIGVFDSGMGGLSVLQHLLATLPNEKFIYLADTKNLPYGDRSTDDIESLTQCAVTWLHNQGCKLIVVACNSASTHSLPNLRAHFGQSLPIVGLVPALKPAVLATATKKVAVLATRATLGGYLLNQVIEEYAKPHGVKVIKLFEPSLVPWVENGLSTNDPAYQKLIDILKQLQSLQVDQLVLGCTHYPFFRHIIKSINPDIQVIDSGMAVANRVAFLLKPNDIRSANNATIDEHPDIETTSKNELSCGMEESRSLFFTTSGKNLDEDKIRKMFVYDNNP